MACMPSIWLRIFFSAGKKTREENAIFSLLSAILFIYVFLTTKYCNPLDFHAGIQSFLCLSMFACECVYTYAYVRGNVCYKRDMLKLWQFSRCTITMVSLYTYGNKYIVVITIVFYRTFKHWHFLILKKIHPHSHTASTYTHTEANFDNFIQFFKVKVCFPFITCKNSDNKQF